MSEQTNDFNLDSNAYWRLAAIFMGFGFMISMAAHLGGPSSAHASPAANTFQDQLAVAQQSDQTLLVGGFEQVDGHPVFVILNEQGTRVGTLPMNTAATEAQPGE